MGRLSKERMEKALAQFKSLSEEDDAKVKAFAALVKSNRSVFYKSPDDYGMSGNLVRGNSDV